MLEDVVETPVSTFGLKTLSRTCSPHSPFKVETPMACHAHFHAGYAPPDPRIVTPTTNISRASEDLGEARAEKRYVWSCEKELNYMM
jgi:hypothetical protein